MNNAETQVSIRDVGMEHLICVPGRAIGWFQDWIISPQLALAALQRGPSYFSKTYIKTFSRIFVKKHLLLYSYNLTDGKFYFIDFNLKIVMFTFYPSLFILLAKHCFYLPLS